jgi:hypothetical protein
MAPSPFGTPMVDNLSGYGVQVFTIVLVGSLEGRKIIDQRAQPDASHSMGRCLLEDLAKGMWNLQVRTGSIDAISARYRRPEALDGSHTAILARTPLGARASIACACVIGSDSLPK